MSRVLINFYNMLKKKNAMSFLNRRGMVVTAVLVFFIYSCIFMAWNKLNEKWTTCIYDTKIYSVLPDALSPKVMIGHGLFKQLFHRPMNESALTVVADTELFGSLVHSFSTPVITKRLKLKVSPDNDARVTGSI